APTRKNDDVWIHPDRNWITGLDAGMCGARFRSQEGRRSSTGRGRGGGARGTKISESFIGSIAAGAGPAWRQNLEQHKWIDHAARPARASAFGVVRYGCYGNPKGKALFHRPHHGS